MTKVFVYGTLMTGMNNHQVINPEAIEKIEVATIENMHLFMVRGGGFPCMIPGTGQVTGEVITIKKAYSKSVMKRMDQLEGYRRKNDPENLYNREQFKVKLSNGSEVKAHVYIFNEERMLGSMIPGGNFRDVVGRTTK